MKVLKSVVFVAAALAFAAGASFLYRGPAELPQEERKSEKASMPDRLDPLPAPGSLRSVEISKDVRDL